MNKFLGSALALSVVLAVSPATAQRKSMGPMPVAPQAESAKRVESVTSLWLPDSAPALIVQTTRSESSKTKPGTKESEETTKRLTIGESQVIPEHAKRIALSQLQWIALADGGRAARVRIEMANATSVRLGYRIDGTLHEPSMRFAGTTEGQLEAGLPANQPDATRWTSLFDGNVAIIELRLEGGQSAVGTLVIDHAVGLDVYRDLTKRVQDIGYSQSCEFDLACVTNASQEIKDAARSVAKIVYQSRDGKTYLCSATLIANASAKPILFTANHCIGDQGEANSIVSYWGFEAATCGSRAIPSFQTVSGGARMIFSDARIDVSFSEMYSSPPNTALLAGWNVDLGRRSAVVSVLHHPSGDLKKYSTGTAVGYTNVQNVIPQTVPWISLPGNQTSSYFTVLWTKGSTEEGSSGSALLTYEPPGSLCRNGCYLVRGALSQGSASCSAPNSPDRFSRLDLAYPYVASTIDPSNAPVPMNGSILTEYYNTTNDHYFVTADGAEAAGLDKTDLRSTGWYRTGEQFGIYPAGTVGTTSVCRFYGDIQGIGPNSHFYTADSGECNFVARAGSGWLRESSDAFRVTLPQSNGTCAAGSKPLYRAFNDRSTQIYPNSLSGKTTTDSNHRYFTDTTFFNIMPEKDTWFIEPRNGTPVPVMCVRS